MTDSANFTRNTSKAVVSRYSKDDRPDERDPHSLEQIADEIRTSESLAKLTNDAYRHIMVNDQEMYKRSKRNLPAVVFGGEFGYRKKDRCIQHSGLVVLDIDHIREEGFAPEDIRDCIAQENGCTLAFISPSQNGVKAVFAVEPAPNTPEEHTEAWRSLCARIESLEFMDGLEIDQSGKDVSRLCYLCNDQNAHFETDVTPHQWKQTTNKTVPTNQIETQADTLLPHIQSHYENYDHWLFISSAFKQAGGSFDVWNEWQLTSNNPCEDALAKWNTLPENKPNRNPLRDLVNAAAERLTQNVTVGRTHQSTNPVLDGDVPTFARRLTEVEEKPITWLWHNMIPRGMVTLVAGKGGTGKSTLLLNIAAQLTLPIQARDQNWVKAGLSVERACRVGLICTEDDYSYLKTRMKLAGVDESKVTIFEKNGIQPNFKEEQHRLDIVTNSLTLDMLIIDPIMHIMNGENNNDPSAVRNRFADLIPIMDQGCAIVGIHHERKDRVRGESASDKVLGSQAWTAVPRSVLQVAVRSHKNAPDKVVERTINNASINYGCIAQTKTNISPGKTGYHFETLIEDEHPVMLIRPEKLYGSPEEMLNLYREQSDDDKERSVDVKAKQEMHEETTAKYRAEASIKELFKQADEDEIPMNELLAQVKDMAAVGDKTAKTVIASLTDHRRSKGRVYRYMKPSEK